MIIPNIIHHEKRGKIEGHTFHVFILDISTAVVFDKQMDIPIIWGGKSLVMATIKNFKEHLPESTKRVRIFYYKLEGNSNNSMEFKMKMKYEGPVTTISTPRF
jgi:hypothetical protein